MLTVDSHLTDRLQRLGAARNRDVDPEPRTVTITDDEALVIANALLNPVTAGWLSDRRLAAATRYARWHLGSSSWAHAILNAFDNPRAAHDALDQAGAPK